MCSEYRYIRHPANKIPENTDKDTSLLVEYKSDVDKPATASRKTYKKIEDSTSFSERIFIRSSNSKIFFLRAKRVNRAMLTQAVIAVDNVIPKYPIYLIKIRFPTTLMITHIIDILTGVLVSSTAKKHGIIILFITYAGIPIANVISPGVVEIVSAGLNSPLSNNI